MWAPIYREQCLALLICLLLQVLLRNMMFNFFPFNERLFRLLLLCGLLSSVGLFLNRSTHNNIWEPPQWSLSFLKDGDKLFLKLGELAPSFIFCSLLLLPNFLKTILFLMSICRTDYFSENQMHIKYFGINLSFTNIIGY